VSVSFAFNCYGRMVKKVKRSLLAVCIAVAVIAMLVVPVSAVVPPVLPTKSPLPKGQPFETIWSLLVILQNQIKAIPAGPAGPAGPTGATGPAGTCNIVIVKGEATTGEHISPPAGFTTSNCDISVRPKEGISLHILYNNRLYHAIGFSFDAYEEGSTANEGPHWIISSGIFYDPDSGPVGTQFVPQPALYTIICPATTS
jgi:hypothetical protein